MTNGRCRGKKGKKAPPSGDGGVKKESLAGRSTDFGPRFNRRYFPELDLLDSHEFRNGRIFDTITILVTHSPMLDDSPVT